VRAREAVHGRGWDVLGDELVGHYERVIARRAVARAAPATSNSGAVLEARERTTPGRPVREPAWPRDATAAASGAQPTPPVAPPPWRRYVAVGDSLTEGLCDESRAGTGEFRGWADRLALLLALASPADPVSYANLAVRSRRVADVVDVQLPLAVAQRADLVSVLVGANDLVGARPDVAGLAARLSDAVGV
ncbi:GDSL-type esterase/lipase family protein, partial [Agromyces humi]|uniref:GDSL-type esterase/lipase family protein n=1 Tax=Agromyces humi TaxID=1766800 RepID=UPI001F3B57D7